MFFSTLAIFQIQTAKATDSSVLDSVKWSNNPIYNYSTLMTIGSVGWHNITGLGNSSQFKVINQNYYSYKYTYTISFNYIGFGGAGFSLGFTDNSLSYFSGLEEISGTPTAKAYLFYGSAFYGSSFSLSYSTSYEVDIRFIFNNTLNTASLNLTIFSSGHLDNYAYLIGSSLISTSFVFPSGSQSIYYIGGGDGVYLSNQFVYKPDDNFVSVTIGAPLNSGVYTTSFIHVSLSATSTNISAIIDKIWYNCKNGSSWIYANNLTYTIQTSMTGFLNGNNYNFFAWANDTTGLIGVNNATFTITNIYFFNGFNFNIQQPIDNSMPLALFNTNKTESNMTTFNWIQLDNNTFGNNCYAFKFGIYINETTSLNLEVSRFLFYTQDSFNVSQNFGYIIISDVSGISSYAIFTDNGINLNGNPINIPNNDDLLYEFTFFYNGTINTYYMELNVYITGSSGTNQSNEGDVGFAGTLGTSTIIETSVFPISMNDQLNLNVSLTGNGIIPSYHLLELWSCIPYTIQCYPNYDSFDSFKMTLEPNEIYTITFQLNIKEPNFTSPLKELHYINGTYWIWTTATEPPFTYYNTANPLDDSFGVRTANSSTFILQYTGTNGFIYHQFSFTLEGKPSDCYEGLMLNIGFYQDVGDFPNFTYSNTAYKVGIFNFVLKYAHVPPLPEVSAIVMNFQFMAILILLVVPMMICILFFWRRIKFYSVIFGAVVDFIIGFTVVISGNPIIPLWVLFFIGGAIVIFIYLKLSQKMQGRI